MSKEMTHWKVLFGAIRGKAIAAQETGRIDHLDRFRGRPGWIVTPSPGRAHRQSPENGTQFSKASPVEGVDANPQDETTTSRRPHHKERHAVLCIPPGSDFRPLPGGMSAHSSPCRQARGSLSPTESLDCSSQRAVRADRPFIPADTPFQAPRQKRTIHEPTSGVHTPDHEVRPGMQTNYDKPSTARTSTESRTTQTNHPHSCRHRIIPCRQRRPISRLIVTVSLMQ